MATPNFYMKKFEKGSLWYAAPTKNGSHWNPFYFLVRITRVKDMQVAIYDYDSGELRENFYFNYSEINENYIVTRLE